MAATRTRRLRAIALACAGMACAGMALAACARPPAKARDARGDARGEAGRDAGKDPRAEDASALEAKVMRDGAVRVIARLAVAPAAQDAVVDAAGVSALADMRGMGVMGATTITETLPFIVADVDAAQLRALQSNRRFDLVVEDRIARPTLAQSTVLIEAPQVWALNGRGAGQAIAILDTGVDATHPFLAGRVSVQACFSTTSLGTGASSECPNGLREQTGAGAARPCGEEGCFHGTHVAGIAAGRGTQFSGVAPDAEIIAVQVFSRFEDRTGGPTPCHDGGQRSPCIASFTSDQIRALDHVRQLAATRAIASVNMSLGGGRSTEACDTDLTKPVIDQLRAAGVATAIAAGNEGFPDAVSFPGCISTAVTVGSTTKADAVSPFSNRGRLIDVYAPGSAISSSVPGGTFSTLSGTSMATPHVAGAFAALKSARPGASVDDIQRALMSTGVRVDQRPRIALLRALQALPATTPVEKTIVVAAAGETSGALAEIAALPANRVVRVLVRARVPQGASATATAAAVKRAGDAAIAAGATFVEPVTGQPIVVVEAKPAMLQALMGSGAVDQIQLDRPAHPQ